MLSHVDCNAIYKSADEERMKKPGDEPGSRICSDLQSGRRIQFLVMPLPVSPPAPSALPSSLRSRKKLLVKLLCTICNFILYPRSFRMDARRRRSAVSKRVTCALLSVAFIFLNMCGWSGSGKCPSLISVRTLQRSLTAFTVFGLAVKYSLPMRPRRGVSAFDTSSCSAGDMLSLLIWFCTLRKTRRCAS